MNKEFQDITAEITLKVIVTDPRASGHREFASLSTLFYLFIDRYFYLKQLTAYLGYLF